MDMKDFKFDLQRFFAGSGTEADPYQIASVADLQQLASDVNGGRVTATHISSSLPILI